jgi:hypothetical protein
MLNFWSNEKKSVTGSSIKDVNLKYVGSRKYRSYVYKIHRHTLARLKTKILKESLPSEVLKNLPRTTVL